MHCVDMALNPAPRPPDFKHFEQREFICASCIKSFPSTSNDLFYFPEVDYFFHKHPDRIFYRALMLTDDGHVHISMFDHEDEHVLQCLGIFLDGSGEHELHYRSLDALRDAAQKFFDAMRAQNRNIEQGTVHFR